MHQPKSIRCCLRTHLHLRTICQVKMLYLITEWNTNEILKLYFDYFELWISSEVSTGSVDTILQFWEEILLNHWASMSSSICKCISHNVIMAHPSFWSLAWFLQKLNDSLFLYHNNNSSQTSHLFEWCSNNIFPYYYFKWWVSLFSAKMLAPFSIRYRIIFTSPKYKWIWWIECSCSKSI